MYRVMLKNGFFEVHPSMNQDMSAFKWLTYYPDGDYYYFLANPITRRLFATQMLSDPECSISYQDKEYLRTLKMSGYLGRYDKAIELPDLGPGKKLDDYQIDVVYRMLEHKNYCLFYGTGTGKTLMAITFLNNAKPHSVLILTPKKVVDQYYKETQKYLTYMPDIEVTNYEQLIHNMAKYSTKHYDCIILDESHRVKDYMSQVNQFIRKNMHFDRMFLFSGTPQDASRMDVMSQLALFDSRFLPSKSKFMRRYFEIDQYFKPISELHPDELTSMINLVSHGRETEQLIDLPDRNDVIINCKKPALYKVIKEDKVYVEEDADGNETFECVCDTAGATVAKLRQICNGYLHDNRARLKLLEDSDKADKFRELALTLDNAIVYTQFDADIPIVEAQLKTLGRTYVIVNGKTSAKKANESIELFKKDKVDFLIIQAASGKEGLDLVNTNNTVFWSLPTSYITFEQCLGRTRRRGQKMAVCNYYFLLCKGSIETQILGLLKKKKSFTGALFNQYK